MFRQILFEMKITFKSVKTMIYIIFTLLYAITILYQTSTRDTGLLTYQQNADYVVASMGGGVFSAEELSMFSPSAKRVVDIRDSINDENTSEYLRLKAEQSIADYEYWEMAYLQLKEKGHKDWFKGAFDDRDYYIKLREDFGHEIVVYELDFNTLNGLDKFYYFTNRAKMNLKFNIDMSLSNEVPGTIYRIDAMTSLLHYFNEVVPNISWVIIILLLMDSMFRDFQNGTIKMLITLPKDRSRYIFVKLISTLFSAIIVLAIPITIIFSLLFIKHGFSSANYPVLSNLNGFFTTKSRFTYSTIAKDINLSNYRTISYGIAKTIEGVYEMVYGAGGIQYLKAPPFEYEIIPLWKMLGVSIVPMFANLLFYSSFGVMMAIIVRNRNAFIAISAMILGISLVVGSTYFGQSWTMFNPMSLNNGLALVQGVLPNTALSCITVLPLYSFICLGITNLRFKKLDIH